MSNPKTSITVKQDPSIDNNQLKIALVKKSKYFPFRGLNVFMGPIGVLIFLLIQMILETEHGIKFFPILGILLLLIFLFSYSITGKQIITLDEKEVSIISIGFLRKTRKYEIACIEKFQVETQNKNLKNLIYFYYLDEEIYFGTDMPLKSARELADVLNEELIRLKESRTEGYLPEQDEQ